MFGRMEVVMKIKPSEIGSILKERILNLDAGPEFVEIG